jgi:hypothetical protein
MTSVERPSYATIVKQTAARFRDGNTLSSNYAQIEYSEGFNQLKLKPAPNAGGGSVSIEQSGGARPELNFYNPVNNSFGSITLETDGRIMSNKNVKIEANGFGGTGNLECKSITFTNPIIVAGGPTPAIVAGYLTLIINGVSRNIPFI